MLNNFPKTDKMWEIFNGHNLTIQENHSMFPHSFSEDAWVTFIELQALNRYNVRFNLFSLIIVTIAFPGLVCFLQDSLPNGGKPFTVH